MIELEDNKYTFWGLLQKVSIKIPIIQRDYAQGRGNRQAKDIRENFLNSLLKVLEDEEKSIDLDFVYGSIKDNYLILLDGQQRVTTLFLLHYFLALKDEKLDDDSKKILQKFTYETRLSSREFIRLLIDNNIQWQDKPISTTIKNQIWFFSDWENDPTIKGMLTMLDSIQEKFAKKEKGLFDKLINQQKIKKITFSFLNLKDFKLTDELYIKMNARGKPLSEFENFKSKFENFIQDEETKSKLDNGWYDIFWKIGIKTNIEEPTKEADRLFLNFFKNITAFYSEDFNNVDIFQFDYSKFINEITKVLDCLSESETEIIDLTIKELRDEKEDFKISLFRDFIEIDFSKIEYEKRLRFYALMCFFLKEGEVSDQNWDLFKKWIRFSLNIIHNSNYNGIEEFKRDKKILDNTISLLDDKFYETLSHSKISKIEQFQEEQLKAKLIMESSERENEFILTENNWYLDGQIRFLIEYAGGEDSFDIVKFKNYRDSFIALWKFAKDNKDNQILLYRALLTKGDYLPEHGSNYTFCSFNTSVREKSENWQMVLNSGRLETTQDDPNRTKYLQKLLDEFINNNLTEIIKNYINDTSHSSCDDWNQKYLYTLIFNDENIKYCNNLQLRYSDAGKKVYLLKKSQMNGTHAELYSYDFYQNYLKFSVSPFEKVDYYSTSSSDEIPCAFINNWKYKEHNFAIDIRFKDEKFSVEFFDRIKKINDIDSELKKFLEENGFILKEDRYYNTQFTLYKEEDLNNFIEIFLKQLDNYQKTT